MPFHSAEFVYFHIGWLHGQFRLTDLFRNNLIVRDNSSLPFSYGYLDVHTEYILEAANLSH